VIAHIGNEREAYGYGIRPYPARDMEKPGISIEIPGHGELRLRHLVSDYTGTLSYRGKLVAGVEERLRRLDALVDIHVLTADTRGPLPSN